jgi:hypothetical protein
MTLIEGIIIELYDPASLRVIVAVCLTLYDKHVSCVQPGTVVARAAFKGEVLRAWLQELCRNRERIDMGGVVCRFRFR